MALFTAVQHGAIDDGATFGNTSPGTKGVDWPNETDDVDAAGYDLTQGAATGVGSLTDLVTTGGTLTLTGSFTCPDVQEVLILVYVTATISFGTSGVDPGCQYSLDYSAIECSAGTITDVTGDLTINAGGVGVYNDGEVVDFSGNLVNSGGGLGVENYMGIWTDFSGTLLNNDGIGVEFYSGTWIDFSGTLVNSGGGIGFFVGDGQTLSDFSGILNNTGTGRGLYLFGSASVLTDFSGQCYDSGSGKAMESRGWIKTITGIISRPSSQPDLAAGNIAQGKTILGVVGTRPPSYGIGGAPMLGG